MPLRYGLGNDKSEPDIRVWQTYLVGFVEVGVVEVEVEVEVLVVAVLVVVLTALLLLDELVLELLVLGVPVEVEVVGLAVVDTGGSPLASTPTKSIMVRAGVTKKTDVFGIRDISHKKTWMSCMRYSQQLETGSKKRVRLVKQPRLVKIMIRSNSPIAQSRPR
jgi:hypothetical protein